jgi:DNA-directed RNA polymerase subunit RPC12/RpoP
MPESLPSDLNSLACTQCGGELHPDEGQIFITCPYCSSTVYLDKSRVVFHWHLATTLDETKARANLARWMAGNQTVKNLDLKSRVTGMNFEYFPIWYFKSKDPAGKERIWLEPAAATSVSEIKSIKLPAGDLRRYDPDLDPQARMPDIPIQTASDWVERRLSENAETIETALVHIPLFTFKYDYKADSYTAIVEGGTGGVFANIFPAKAEAPYQLAGGLTAVVFLCLATFPVIGALLGRNGGGFLVGLAACAGIGIIAAPALFALAIWVASKV